MTRFPQISNLQRWKASEEPGMWVDAHQGKWDHGDWINLVEQLEASKYWPVNLDDVGLHLEKVKQEYCQVRDQATSTEPHGWFIARPLQSALRWYGSGFALLGIAVGFLTGASSTPIVSALLPLLFALIGGTSGLYLAQTDFAQAYSLLKTRALGICLTAFVCSCLIGTAFGIMLRTGNLPLEQSGLVDYKKPYTSDMTQLVILRNKLHLLGASNAEEKQVLKTAVQELNDAQVPVPVPKLDNLIRLCVEVRGELSSTVDKSIKSGLQPPDVVTRAIATLQGFENALRPWTDSSVNRLGMPRELFMNRLESPWFWLGKITRDRKSDVESWMVANKFDDHKAYQLLGLLHEEFATRDVLDWKTGTQVTGSVDAYLKMILGAKVRPSDEVLPVIDDAEKPHVKLPPEIKAPADK